MQRQKERIKNRKTDETNGKQQNVRPKQDSISNYFK